MKAAFLDRDGVINALVLDQERQMMDSPYRVEAVRLLPGAAEGIRLLNRADIPVIIVSNQPGRGKFKCTQQQLEVITLRLQALLGDNGAHWDGIYYCLHHPAAQLPEYRRECDCRKPKPGLLRQAAKIHKINLRESYMVGDDLVDVLAGKAAGCQTIFLGRYKCVTCWHWTQINARPNHIVPNLLAAAKLIQQMEGKDDIS